MKTPFVMAAALACGILGAVEQDRPSFGPLAVSAVVRERTQIWPKGKMPHVQPHQTAQRRGLDGRAVFDPADPKGPFIEWYEPAASNRTQTCVLVLSGGGFLTCMDARRLQPAIDRFVRAGLTVANLTYRTPRPRGLPIHQSAWADAQRAVRVIRAEATKRGYSPDRIGATGISAGAKAVLLLALSSRTPAYARVDELDDLPCRLAFAIPQAPAYVLTDGAAGENARGGEGADIVAELKFDADTSPLCCLQGGADAYSPIGSVRLYQRLSKMGVPAELHLFADRWHGFHGDANRAANGTAWDHWCELMLDFIAQFEPKLVREGQKPCVKPYGELKAALEQRGLPSVLVCGKGETEALRQFPETWLERRRRKVQSDLHVYSVEIDDGVRAARLREFANHCGIRDFEDALCSPAYFWMWNDRLDVPALCRQLDDMRAQGLRNVCAHPFPKGFRTWFHTDMEPDYLTDEYLRVFAEVTRHATELGMHCYLYDEGGWPSGGACGLVAKEDKEGRLAQRWISPGEGGRPCVRTDGYDFRGPAAPYPSIIEKGTAERFLALTHERYAKVLGGLLGSSVCAAFTDEPNAPAGLGWTTDFLAEFKARKGYDLEPHLAEMLRRKAYSEERVCELAIDYRDVLADLVVDRFLAPVRDWCRAHKVLSGGHMNGENDMASSAGFGHGSILRSLRAMDLPGVDVIWRQAFPAVGDKPAEAPPFPRYASSAAHLNGGRFALSESFGIFGDSVTPGQMKWLVDYQLVRGINTFVFGYYAQTNRGHWMTLFEPHCGPVVPYWTFQRPFFAYVERLCRELSRGRSAADTVVLYDVRAIWAGGEGAALAARAHRDVAAALNGRQVDYDFAEDRDLAAAKVNADGSLTVGAAAYRTVVLPTWRWMDGKAAAKLGEFERAGGRVVRGTDVSSVPRTLDVSGPGAADLRVLRRTDGGRTLYFTHNEAMALREVRVAFPSKTRVVRFDPDSVRWETVSRDGTVERTYAPGETALYAVGEVPDAPEPLQYAGTVRTLDGPWTIRPMVAHVAGKDDIEIRACTNAAKTVALGDWRPALGERFCGRVVYCTAFAAPAAESARLDLGEVKYAARVRMNGKDLGPRFFGPYCWDVQLVAGTNVLEVEVANLLVNQLGHADVRDRIARDYPPKSLYDRFLRPYDQENHASGLYGPVTVQGGRTGE